MSRARPADFSPQRPLVFALSREQAAGAVGVSPTTFDELVRSGAMPPPRQITSKRIVWDVDEVHSAFKALPHRDSRQGNSWSDV